MFTLEEKKHYQRHFILPGFGEQAQKKLKQARVLMIGAGGLGCPALQYLAAAGVGTIGIVDGDKVEASNLHRQVLYGTDDLGKYKAQCAVAHLQKLNPHIHLIPHIEFLNTGNALELIAQYDLVIDGSDNFQTRYLVNDACVMLDKAFIYGAIYTFQGQVSVFNYLGGPTYRCLYPEPPDPEDAPNCAEIGVLGILPGIIGNYQALEAIKMIAGIGDVLSGKLLLIDTLKQSHLKLDVSLNPSNLKINQLINYDAFCRVNQSAKQMTWKTYQAQHQSAFLLDVREPHEFTKHNQGGTNIPLSQLTESLARIPKNQQIIAVCQSGKRSAAAQKLLEENGLIDVWNMEGGYNSHPDIA